MWLFDLYYKYAFLNISFSLTRQQPAYLCMSMVSLGKAFNPLPHKTWEKKKMLITSIFFFSHNVFYPIKDNFNILSSI